MKNQIIKIIVALMIIILSVGSTPVRNTAATSSSYTVPSFTPAWTTGIISDGVGPAGIVVTDLDQDGKVDIAACANGFAYVINYQTDGTYDTTWYSEYIGCHVITTGDRDSDGVNELYIATEVGQILVYDGSSHILIDTFSLPYGTIPVDIAVGDVDDDSHLEVVVVTSDATLVYDALNFNLKWQAGGFSGTQVAIGNLDDDPVNEIVVNNYPGYVLDGYVLNAKLKSQEWSYPGGFGMNMDIGDVDADGRDEIAYFDNMVEIYVLEGDTQTIRWQIPKSGDTTDIAVADTNKDGMSEVLIGYAPFGSVTGYQGTDGSFLWAIPCPEYSIYGIVAGDVDNDSVNEIVWGTGWQALNIGSWVTQTIVWSSVDLDGPLYVAAKDIDLDGQAEIVMASKTTSSDYDLGRINVYDGLTHQVEWSTDVNNSYMDIYQMEIGQADSDPALEIIIGGTYGYSSTLISYDGITHSVEWISPALASGATQAMTLMDLDNDSIDEIIVGLSSSNVQVFHGASDLVQWDSGRLAGTIKDLAAGDVNGNGIKEIAVLTDQLVYLFDSSTWTEKFHRAIQGGELIAIAESDLESTGSLDVVYYNNIYGFILQAWAGPGFPIRWQANLGNLYLKDLESADVDSDGVRELVLMGSEGENGSLNSVLWIGSHVYPRFWEYKYIGKWGTINSMALSDIDSDGQTEFLFGSDHVIQVDEISTSSVDVHRAMIPVINRACLPFFSDDFGNPNSGWPNEDAGTVLFAYENNEYRILIRPTWYAAGARPGIQVTDYRASVDVRNQTGAMGSYGLVFALSQDWSSFYTLEVYPDGWYGIYRYNGNTITALAESYSPYINQGTAANKIEVERNGSQIKAYANGKLLSSLTDNYFGGNRYVGLVSFSYDQPNLDVRYDNFVIDQLKCGGLNTSSTSLDNWQPSPGYRLFNNGLPMKSGHDQP
jgi:hypothetical protein